MEPYFEAYRARDLDVGALHDRRQVGAANMGGYAVENLLKYMVVRYHGLSRWGDNSAVDGTPIKNVTNHDLLRIIHAIDPLRNSLTTDVSAWIETIQQPIRSNPMIQKFVDLRYQGEHVMDAEYENWYHAYTSLMAWLIDQPEYQ